LKALLISIGLVGVLAAQASENAPNGYRFPSEADYSGDWKEFRATVPTPFVVRADFNGDGRLDEAWLLPTSSGTGWGLFAAWARRNDRVVSFGWSRTAKPRFRVSVLPSSSQDSTRQPAGKAVALFRRSGEAGHLLSVYSLAGAYMQGLGVEKNEREALALYKRAANGGNANAQVNLGSLYRFGIGVQQDLGEAVKWFRAAARQGHPRAEKILGYCYAEGIGVERDDAESVRWMKQAADKDDPEAQYLLGLKYVHGVGVSVDLEEASRWFRLAAERCESRAQYNLGVAYAKGQGIPRDLVRAHLWFSLAASQNGLAL
jgi:TPR repeat protein